MAWARRRRQRGLTMIELVMFIVIVGIAVVGVLGVISFNTRGSADPIRQKQAMAIAESLVDEIRAARFSWCHIGDENYSTAAAAANCTVPEGPGQEAGGGLRPFDNVNDYVTSYGVARTYNTDVVGTPFPAGYAATVTITQAGIGPAGTAVPATESLRIQVTVSYDNSAVALESYRTRYAPNN
jgi:MSHA pilin protein MshD